MALPRALGFLAIGAIALAAGCSADDGGDAAGETLDPIVEPTARVVDAEPGTDVDVEDGALVFPEPLRDDVAKASPGDVLVSGRGQGFLRRVVAMKHDGGKVVVTTEPAALTDVFQQAHVRAPATVESGATNPSAFGLSLPALGIGSLRVPLGGESDITIEEGSFALHPNVDWDFVVRERRLQRMKLVVNAPASAKLRVKYHLVRPATVQSGVTVRFGEPGKVIAEAPPKFVVLWVGGVPVVAVVKVQLLLGWLLEVGGDVSGESSLSADGDVSAGVSYDGAWHDVATSTLSVKTLGSPTFASTTFGGDVTLSARLSVSFYDLAGPWVELQGYAGVGRETKGSDADVYGELGLRGLVGVEAAPFGKLVVGYQSVLFDKGLHVPIAKSP